MSPPGTSSVSIWIGSFPPMPDIPFYCTSTGNVYTLIPPVSRVRKTMYRHFNRLIPQEAHMCLSFVRYRLRFRYIAELNELFNFRYPYDPNEVNVIYLRMTRFWTPPIHPEDLFYTTLIPPPRDSPPGSPERLQYIDKTPTP